MCPCLLSLLLTYIMIYGILVFQRFKSKGELRFADNQDFAKVCRAFCGICISIADGWLLMDALSRNDVIAINHLIYNCTWSYDTETPLTTADAKLADELTKSRSFTVTDKGIYNSDTNNLTLTIRLTVLNMARFETKLTEAVADDVKAQMYEGIKITDPSDTDQIIQKHKLELLQNPQAFYSTGVYSVNMVLSKGQWRIDMTDELYQALLGLD